MNAIVFVLNVGSYKLNTYRMVNLVACLAQLYLSVMINSPATIAIWGVAVVFWAMMTSAREQLCDIQRELLS